MTVETARLFETPLVIDDVPGAAALNAELLAVIAERRRRDPQGVQISNILGWHSDTRMLEWGGDAAKRLAVHAVELAGKFSEDIADPNGGRYVWVPEMWANVSGRGAANQYHCHAGSFWAAVYYVDDGYAGSPDRTLGGEIELEDPRMPMILMDGPDLRMRPPGAQGIDDPEVRIRPQAGKMLMFPGWLRHGVRPYLGSGQRVSIALNLTAVRAV